MAIRLNAHARLGRWAALFAIPLFPVLVFLMGRSGAPALLALAIGLGGSISLLVWPELATIAVVFLLYTNIPTIASQLHGVPRFAAASFVLLLGVPLLHHLVLRHEKPRMDRPFVLMLAYLAVLLLSSLFARDAGIAQGQIGTFLLEGVVLYWLVINVIRRWSSLTRVIWTVLAAGSLLGALSLYQGATGSYQNDFGGLAQRDAYFDNVPGDVPRMRLSQRAGGPVGDGDPNRYAQIMVVLLPLALFQMRRARTRTWRICAAGAGILILSGVLLSYSRGAFVVLALLLGAAALLRWVRPIHLVTSLLALGILVATVAPTYYQRVATLGTAADLVEGGSSASADGSIRGRATEMLAALRVFLDHPLIGVGPGQYLPFYSVDYQQSSVTRFRNLRNNRRAHILYFELAAETGFLGFTAFMLIVLVLLLQLWRARRRWAHVRPEFADLATAFWLSIVAYLGTALFLHLSYQRYYWFLIALAAAALQVMRAELPEDSGRRLPRQSGEGSMPRRPRSATPRPVGSAQW